MATDAASWLLLPSLKRLTTAPSGIITNATRASELRRRNIDVISMGIGESDLGTPAHVIEAVERALRADATKCTAPGGTPETLECIRAWLAKEYEGPFGSDEVVISAGSKYLLYQIFMALFEADEEMLIPSPGWPTIAALTSLVGARPRLVPCDPAAGFVPDPARFAAAVNDRTRALYIANPGNPTGVALSADALRPLVELCAQRSLTLVYDAAYRALCYDAPAPNLPRMAAEMGVPCVIVETLSKRYAMSGWRFGFAAAHPRLIAAITAIQSQTITCVPALTQAAAIAAMSGSQQCVTEAVALYRKRLAVLTTELRKLPHVTLPYDPNAGFFAMPDFSAYLGARTPDDQVLTDDEAVVDHLLEVAHVSAIAGSSFGLPGHLRLSCTLPEARIAEGVARIGRALAGLRRA